MKKLTLFSAIVLLSGQMALAGSGNEDCPFRKSGNRSSVSELSRKQRVASMLNGTARPISGTSRPTDK